MRSRIEFGIETGKQNIQSLLNKPRIRFGELELNILPRAPGVYLIYEKNDPVYVGSSTNIRRRVCYQLFNARNHYFASHLIRYKFHNKVRFKDYLIRQCAVQYMETDGADEAKWIERFVAGAIRPIYNGGSKSFQND